jgi:hypothetical protein
MKDPVDPDLFLKIDRPRKSPYNLRIGGTTSWDSSALVKSFVTICGKEKLKIRDFRQKHFTFKMGNNVKFHAVSRAEYEKWFELDYSDPDASEQCGVQNYFVQKVYGVNA